LSAGFIAALPLYRSAGRGFLDRSVASAPTPTIAEVKDSARALGRFLILLLASFGPLAPIMLLFLLAMPPLVALSGWPWWVDLIFAGGECGLIVVVVLWLGPGALASVREYMDEERRR
jgi:hypothetical protein